MERQHALEKSLGLVNAPPIQNVINDVMSDSFKKGKEVKDKELVET